MGGIITVKDNPIVDSILRRAARFEAKHVRALRYLEPDNGADLCRACAEKRAKADPKLEVWCGDQSASHDSPPTCEDCHAWLSGFLTDYGAREELACLEGGFDRRRHLDCWLWMLCENSFLRDSEEYRRLLRVAGVADG